MRMDSVLVEVRIPAADTKYDALIPKKSRGAEVVKILTATFSKMFEGKFKGLSDSVICVLKTGEELDINKTIYEQGIVDGDILILI